MWRRSFVSPALKYKEKDHGDISRRRREQPFGRNEARGRVVWASGRRHAHWCQRSDLLDGGAGQDTASYRTAKRGVLADLSDPGANTGAAARGDQYVSIENLVGSRFDDELRGGFGGGALFGGSGDDRLVDQSGTTQLIGGKGADELVGLGISAIAAYWDASSAVRVDLQRASRNTGDAAGDTFDNINGVEGSDFGDRLLGDGRDNLLVGLRGRDDLSGRSGNDRLNGGGGADDLSGGRGFDIAVYSEAGRHVTVDLANAGRNKGEANGDKFSRIEGIEGSGFNDKLRGDGDENRLLGGLGNDRMNGRAGNDSLMGQLGNDRLSGGGVDLLSGGLGSDRLAGGRDLDRAIYWTASSGLTVDLQRAEDNTGEARGDVFRSIEGLDGSNFSDILRGDDGANRLSGRDGDDLLDGRGGDDVFLGGLGDDDLRGGAGDDTLQGEEGADRLNGAQGVDTASYFLAAAGVTADLGNAALNQGDAAGDTYRSIENLVGSGSADTLRGDGADNRISGEAGDDLLEGGGGADRLVGQVGDDTLIGGGGGDTLVGGSGRDTLTGNADADRFVFDVLPSNRAFDDIADFEVGVDVILRSAWMLLR